MDIPTRIDDLFASDPLHSSVPSPLTHSDLIWIRPAQPDIQSEHNQDGIEHGFAPRRTGHFALLSRSLRRSYMMSFRVAGDV
jgi:hypothetical protein